VTNFLPTATETEEEARAARFAILPVGSFEQHGSYLPLITDTVIACAISRELVSAYGVFMLSPVTISCSHEHSAWRGTVSISSRTLQAIVDDIYQSVTTSGYQALIVVNAHGGNYVLSNIVQEGSSQGKSIALFPARDDWKEARHAGNLATSDHEDMHAGELETSILLHADRELVKIGYHSADWVANDRRHLLTIGMRGYTRNGVIGRPSLATAEKGKAVLDSLTESFTRVLETLDSLRDTSNGGLAPKGDLGRHEIAQSRNQEDYTLPRELAVSMRHRAFTHTILALEIAAAW
jgi:creatinine amidohydrolase